MKLKKGSLVLLFASMMLAGCGRTTTSSAAPTSSSAAPTSSVAASSVAASSVEQSSEAPVKNVWVVTFDENYEGGQKTTVEVAKGLAVSAPSNPTRTGYLFTGWFTAATGGEAVDFSTVISADVTYYAQWEQVDASNICNITFHYNYEGATEPYQTVQMKKKRRIQQITEPTRDGYRFAGWYDDAECTTEHDWTATVSEDKDLYALWLTEYVFEAEYTNLDGKAGLGYSGNCSDIEMIQKDYYDGGASNGYYISWLYYNGAYIEWEINATAACTDAWLTARLSVEFFDMTLDQDTYQTYVNDTLQTETYTIQLAGAVAAGTKDIRPFEDFVLNVHVSLNEGNNKIKLVTNNDDYYTGTMSASSPLVDCIKVATNDATLSWADGYPKTDNLRLYQD